MILQAPTNNCKLKGTAAPCTAIGPNIFTDIAFETGPSAEQLGSRHVFVSTAAGAVFEINYDRSAHGWPCSTAQSVCKQQTVHMKSCLHGKDVQIHGSLERKATDHFKHLLSLPTGHQTSVLQQALFSVQQSTLTTSLSVCCLGAVWLPSTNCTSVLSTVFPWVKGCASQHQMIISSGCGHWTSVTTC